MAKPISRIKEFFVKSFLAGLSVLIPLYFTLYILEVIVTSFDTLITLLPEAIRPHQWLFPGAGLLFAVVLATSAGVLVRNYFGRNFVRLFNRLVDRIPVVAGLYGLLRQVSEAVLGEGKKSFSRVILVEWPRRDSWMIAFVTAETQGPARPALEVRTQQRKFLNVFIPTTPNPTSGFYFMVAEKDVISLDMTVDQAFKAIISAGAIAPDVVSSLVPGQDSRLR